MSMRWYRNAEFRSSRTYEGLTRGTTGYLVHYESVFLALGGSVRPRAVGSRLAVERLSCRWLRFDFERRARRRDGRVAASPLRTARTISRTFRVVVRPTTHDGAARRSPRHRQGVRSRQARHVLRAPEGRARVASSRPHWGRGRARRRLSHRGRVRKRPPVRHAIGQEPRRARLGQPRVPRGASSSPSRARPAPRFKTATFIPLLTVAARADPPERPPDPHPPPRTRRPPWRDIAGRNPFGPRTSRSTTPTPP